MPWSRLYFYTSSISLVYLIYLLMQDDFILSLRNGDTRANSFIYYVEGGEKERDRGGEEEDLETVYTLSAATEDRCVITMYARLGYRRIRSGNKIVRRTQILYKLLHFIRSLFQNRKLKVGVFTDNLETLQTVSNVLQGFQTIPTIVESEKYLRIFKVSLAENISVYYVDIWK